MKVSINQWKCQLMNECVNEWWMCQQINEWMSVSMN